MGSSNLNKIIELDGFCVCVVDGHGCGSSDAQGGKCDYVFLRQGLSLLGKDLAAKNTGEITLCASSCHLLWEA